MGEVVTLEPKKEVPEMLINPDVKPEVHFNREVWDKIMFFVNRTNMECSGVGIVKIEKNVLRVVDAIMVAQKNSMGDTELCSESLAKAMYHYQDNPDHMNFWWHSHHNMGVFWSGTDMEAIKQLGGHGWILASVFNKREEVRSALAYVHEKKVETVTKSYFKSPFGEVQSTGESVVSNPDKLMFVDDLVTRLYRPQYSKETLDAWEAEFKANELTKEFEEKERAERAAKRGNSREEFLDRIQKHYRLNGQGFWVEDQDSNVMYGRSGFAGCITEYGYRDSEGTFVAYTDDKDKIKWLTKANKLRKIDNKAAQKKLGKKLERLGTYGDLFEPGFKLDLPKHLSAYQDCWNEPLPHGLDYDAYTGLLERYRFILEMDELKLVGLVASGNTPRVGNDQISSFADLVFWQEYLLDGGDMAWNHDDSNYEDDFVTRRYGSVDGTCVSEADWKDMMLN